MNIILKSLTITLSLIAGLQAMDDSCPEDVKRKILTEVVKDNYLNLGFTDFINSVRTLREVCKQWSSIISKNFTHEAMVLGCQQNCPEFLNSKLIYRPKVRSDEGMIEFKISDLWNPLGGTFDISSCKFPIENKYNYAVANDYISISTGYQKSQKAENENKLEIWFTPPFVVEKEFQGTTGYFKEVFPPNCQRSVPVGIIWNRFVWTREPAALQHQATENTDNLSKINLDENWKKAAVLMSGWRGGNPLDVSSPSFTQGTIVQACICYDAFILEEDINKKSDEML